MRPGSRLRQRRLAVPEKQGSEQPRFCLVPIGNEKLKSNSDIIWVVVKIMVPFLGTLNIRCPIIIGIQKGTTILTTTHMVTCPVYNVRSGDLV